MDFVKGRPLDTSGREDREIRVYDMLDNLGIEYFRVDHAPANKMEACAEIDKVLGIRICKNLFLNNRQMTKFYLLMMPVDKPFHTREVSPQIHSARLSFGDEDHMVEFLDVHPGSVSILGLMNDKEKRVQLLIDEDLLGLEYLGCHPCKNTSSLRIRTRDIIDTFLPAVDHNYIKIKITGD